MTPARVHLIAEWVESCGRVALAAHPHYVKLGFFVFVLDLGVVGVACLVTPAAQNLLIGVSFHSLNIYTK